ncbi:hypothetical protein, partial [Streptomyces scabiei]|uniref:hypothetical protein n=1 Tax=Streptomyces scabiei TaxID=1930 RepID=UPI0038F71208
MNAGSSDILTDYHRKISTLLELKEIGEKLVSGSSLKPIVHLIADTRVAVSRTFSFFRDHYQEGRTYDPLDLF